MRPPQGSAPNGIRATGPREGGSRYTSAMALNLRTPTGPIHSLDDWATTTAPRQWANGRAARELARAWWKPGVGPEVPAELSALLSPFVTIDEVQVDDGARLRIAARDANGPMAVYVRGVSDETLGDRIETVLVDAARRVASDRSTGVVDRLQAHAAAVLAPWREGLPHLGELRVELLRDLVATAEHAGALGAPRACFVVHEIVHLQKTKESARRRTREDLDLFVRRLTDGLSERLYRGQLLGPLTLPGFPGLELFVGKIRRDLG